MKSGQPGAFGRRKRLSHQIKDARGGQALMEFAVVYASVILPLTFMTIFVAEMFWV